MHAFSFYKVSLLYMQKKINVKYSPLFMWNVLAWLPLASKAHFYMM